MAYETEIIKGIFQLTAVIIASITSWRLIPRYQKRKDELVIRERIISTAVNLVREINRFRFAKYRYCTSKDEVEKQFYYEKRYQSSDEFYSLMEKARGLFITYFDEKTSKRLIDVYLAEFEAIRKTISDNDEFDKSAYLKTKDQVGELSRNMLLELKGSELD